MKRRSFLAASAATLALPAVSQAERSRVLKFIAQSDLAIVDPIWTTAYVTRNHGFMVFDTLYGQTGQVAQARPALAAAIDLYRAMAMTFWLPQAEAALAQVVGQ